MWKGRFVETITSNYSVEARLKWCESYLHKWLEKNFWDTRDAGINWWASQSSSLFHWICWRWGYLSRSSYDTKMWHCWRQNNVKWNWYGRNVSSEICIENTFWKNGSIIGTCELFDVDCCETEHFILFICLFGRQCFLCKTRTEFDDLCATLKKDIISTGCQTLFEITETSQIPWQSSPLNLYQPQSTNTHSGHSPNSNCNLFR